MVESDLRGGEVYESQEDGFVILRDKGVFDGLFSYHFFSLNYNSHLYWQPKQLKSKLKDFELEDNSKKNWLKRNKTDGKEQL